MEIAERAWKTRGEAASGQTTVEYVMLLAVVVTFFALMVQVLRPAFATWSTAIGRRIETSLFNPRGFHRFPINER